MVTFERKKLMEIGAVKGRKNQSHKRKTKD
jgi:hypothetical protein